MNRQELLEEIRRLSFEENLRYEYLSSDGFLYQHQHLHIKLAFDDNRVGKEKWHQIVRFALSDKESHKYMYRRLLHLLLRYRKSYKNYFRLKTERGTTLFPDRVSDINRMFILAEQYFRIFHDIIKRIHFDYPLLNSREAMIKGRINWEQTLRESRHQFPLVFNVSKWKREFDTPENILLLLPALWLNREAKRLLKIDFVEPLIDKEKSILNQLVNKTQETVFFFPFSEILQSVNRCANLSFHDRRIIELELTAEIRMNREPIRARGYRNLLYWIKEFRELNLRMMTPARTNFLIETIEDLDTIYEAWIFFEFVDFLSGSNLLASMY